MTTKSIHDGDSLADRVFLPHHILVALTMQDGLHINDPSRDRLTSHDISVGTQTPLSEDEFVVWRDADWLEEFNLLDRLGEFLDVAHVLSVTSADLDVADLRFADLIVVHV